MRYEVQHYTLLDGWINTWSYAEDDGVWHPETFASAKEAHAALDEYFQDLAEEVLAGQIEPYDRDEFRVRNLTGIAGQTHAAGGAP